MDSLRLTLAICAGLLAFGFLAAWLLKGREQQVRRSKAALFYSVLLFASAAVLYRGAIVRHETEIGGHAQANEPEQLALKSDSDAADQQQVNRDSSSTLPMTKADPVGVKLNQKSEPPNIEKTRVVLPSRISGKGKKELLVSSDARMPVSVRDQKPQPAPEDVVEAGVLYAFDLIEVFFERYGSPAPTSGKRLASTGGVIEFVHGSSQLNEHSLSYLNSVARQLKTEYVDGHIEIRAQTNEEVASTAERLNLTQSRAEAVRDVLAAAGIPSDRLVAVGTEKAGENRVKIVHRPN